MSGLSSALVAMAFTSVAWFVKGGAIVGALAGGLLAYLAIARVITAQGVGPQRVGVRRLAAVCCLVWALVLPITFGAAGLLWGLARGLGNVVEGPVSTTVRATTHTWLTRANGLRAGVLARFPLAKRLSDSEVMTVVRAAPEWLSEAVERDEGGAAWGNVGGVSVPPQVMSFVRQEYQSLTGGDRAAWLRAEVDRLRSRAQGAAANRPTLQETIEALVAPSVFRDASAAIRARAGRFVRLLVLAALGLSAALGGLLWLAWRRPAVAQAAAAGKREAAGGAAHG
jgi:hypothetical protein